MTCTTVNEHLDDFVDGALGPADAAALNEHLADCADCRRIASDARKLQDLLQAYGDTDVPEASTEFFDQALLRAVVDGARARRLESWLHGFGSAAVAGLAFWVLGGMFFNTPTVPDVTIPSVTMTLEEPRTVNLVFSSATDLIDARLTVVLPEGIEVAGFAGKREISWQTSLSAGRNVLPLKLIATSPQVGEILATLQHDDDDRSFRLRVIVI